MSLSTELVRISEVYVRRADLDTPRAQVWEDQMTGDLHAFRHGADTMVRVKEGVRPLRRDMGGIV